MEIPSAGGVGTTTALVLALASTAVLAALHLLAPRIRKLPLIPERATASFAGGLAVAYVFLHLLPELARGSEELRELFGEEGSPSPLLEFGIFIVALVGFLAFYALERLAERSQHGVGAPSGDEAARGERLPEPGTGDRGVFRVHLGSFLIYNAIITYTLPSTYRTGLFFAVLFTVAMGLHFVLSDRGLEEHYGRLFDRWPPRLMLAGALVLGWVLALFFAPTRSVTVSVLTALLAGGILLNVFKEEIPSARRSSLRWFTVGLVSYALLLGAIVVLEGSGEEPGSEQAAVFPAVTSEPVDGAVDGPSALVPRVGVELAPGR
jgi:hypothetical protein